MPTSRGRKVRPETEANYQLIMSREEREFLSAIASEYGKHRSDIIRKSLKILDSIRRGETSLVTKDGSPIPISIIFS